MRKQDCLLHLVNTKVADDVDNSSLSEMIRAEA